MRRFATHTGIAAPFPQADVNTDVIYPQRFLRRPSREGMGALAFHDLRFDADGERVADFILNREPYDQSTVLVAGPNFGAGSSREHAPWALADFGIRCIVSTLFADIFKANCINNGIVPAEVSDDALACCLETAANPQTATFTIDLVAREIRNRAFGTLSFDIKESHRGRLLEGEDFIDQTLRHDTAIEGFEAQAAVARPWHRIIRARTDGKKS